jgi:hypothetical protein
MLRQDRLSELKSDQKTFLEELLGKIGNHGYKIKNKSGLKKLTEMNHTDLQNIDLHRTLMEIVNFPVTLR